MVVIPVSPTLTDTLASGPPSARVTVPVTVPLSWAVAPASGTMTAQRRPRASGRTARRREGADEGMRIERPLAGGAAGVATLRVLQLNTRRLGEQHRRAAHPARAEARQSLVRLRQRQRLGRHLQRHPPS